MRSAAELSPVCAGAGTVPGPGGNARASSRGPCGRAWCFFFFSSRRRHTRCSRDWSSDVCSSDLLKWDFNRNWSEPGWDQVPADEQRRVYVEFVRHLYAILADLRRKHPTIEIESCSGGGGRVDLGILRFTDEVWPSDNTDPFDRLTIQDGFT